MCMCVCVCVGGGGVICVCLCGLESVGAALAWRCPSSRTQHRDRCVAILINACVTVLFWLWVQACVRVCKLAFVSCTRHPMGVNSGRCKAWCGRWCARVGQKRWRVTHMVGGGRRAGHKKRLKRDKKDACVCGRPGTNQQLIVDDATQLPRRRKRVQLSLSLSSSWWRLSTWSSRRHYSNPQTRSGRTRRSGGHAPC